MTFNIALLPGDGIGPEITKCAVQVLSRVAEIFGHNFNFTEYPFGGRAIDLTGEPLPKETLDGCLQADSVLLGAVGGPKWDTLPGTERPERGLLGLRAGMKLYANLRPCRLMPALTSACPLRAADEKGGFDILIVRELCGGLYFGRSGRRNVRHTISAFDTESYSEQEIERIGRAAFEAAAGRSGRLVSIDKANVLESSRLWREVMHRLSEQYTSIEYSDMLVDNAAMQLVKNPWQFDVIVTSNMFGDILSDEAAQLTGSIGLLPSASLGENTGANGKIGLYEPIHGSAPDIAGTGTANPLAAILSAAMMLKYSFGLKAEEQCINSAVEAALADGCRTADVAGIGTALTTEQMTSELIARM